MWALQYDLVMPEFMHSFNGVRRQRSRTSAKPTKLEKRSFIGIGEIKTPRALAQAMFWDI
jgi:hypothetical protein